MNNTNDTTHASEPPDATRAALMAVWADQAVQNPAHWPAVRERLLSRHGARVESAVATLSAAFANGPPADALTVIWLAFPLLDAAHRVQLIEMLTANQTRGQS